MLKIYNTLTRKKDIFKPISKKEVGLYSCGPTVYWFQHIGNLRTYISNDILKRVLLFNNYKVKHIINVTDVGHLTNDSDTGDDKIEKAAKKENKTASEISKFYFNYFIKDLKKLNIIEPNTWTWATAHIKEQIELIKKLEKKGYLYNTSDGIYFDSSKLKDYGKLARLNISQLKSGKRIEIGEKRNKTDFAVWKFSKHPGERQQEWNSPWGIGFPGWHLECSAMSSKYLGEHFDIHTGGQDHIPVHHTNEIAQSEAAFGKKPWVNYWVHFGWLLSEGEKISKSKGGLYTIEELEKEDFNPLEFRYMCLTTKYSKPLNFSIKNLEKAKESYQRLKNIIEEIKPSKKINKKYLEDFKKAINNDLNIPGALQIIWKLIRNKEEDGKYSTIKEMDKVFGLDLLKKTKQDIPEFIKTLAQERIKARKEKNWKKSDDIREKINKLGYTIEDIEDGYKIKKL